MFNLKKKEGTTGMNDYRWSTNADGTYNVPVKIGDPIWWVNVGDDAAPGDLSNAVISHDDTNDCVANIILDANGKIRVCAKSDPQPDEIGTMYCFLSEKEAEDWLREMRGW